MYYIRNEVAKSKMVKCGWKTHQILITGVFFGDSFYPPCVFVSNHSNANHKLNWWLQIEKLQKSQSNIIRINLKIGELIPS